MFLYGMVILSSVLLHKGADARSCAVLGRCSALPKMDGKDARPAFYVRVCEQCEQVDIAMAGHECAPPRSASNPVVGAKASSQCRGRLGSVLLFSPDGCPQRHLACSLSGRRAFPTNKKRKKGGKPLATMFVVL